MSSHSLSHRSAEVEYQARPQAVQHFADQLKQFPISREHVSRLERDIAKLALAAMAASSRRAHGEPILADDSFLWRKSAELFDNIFICHRNAEKGTEFAVIERFPSGANEIWTKGRNAVDVLKEFTREQQHALQIWTEDISAQINEFLAEKYPGHNLAHVAEDVLHQFSQTGTTFDGVLPVAEDNAIRERMRR